MPAINLQNDAVTEADANLIYLKYNGDNSLG